MSTAIETVILLDGLPAPKAEVDAIVSQFRYAADEAVESVVFEEEPSGPTPNFYDYLAARERTLRRLYELCHGTQQEIAKPTCIEILKALRLVSADHPSKRPIKLSDVPELVQRVAKAALRPDGCSSVKIISPYKQG